MREQWTICPLAPQYEVSTWGRVRSLETGQLRKVQQHKATGYLSIALWDKTTRKLKRLAVHRMVASAFIDNPYNLPEVNHIDGNRANNNVFNLEWVNRVDNLIHSVKELGSHRKLNDKQVREIQNLYVPYAKSGTEGSAKWLAERYGVNESTIYRVTNAHTCYIDKSVNRPSLTKKDMDSIIARYTPYNIKSIMAEYNMSVQTFYKWILPTMGTSIEELKEKYYTKIIQEVEYRKNMGEKYRDILPQYCIAQSTYNTCKKKYGNKMN